MGSQLTIATTGATLGVAVGTTRITYRLPTGCYSADSVTVMPNPAPITGVTQACPGTSTVLADGSAGGVWSSLNPGVATVGASTGVVVGVFPDTTTIFYTLRPNCIVTTTVLINHLPLPISSRDTLCPFTLDTARDAMPGGTWSTTTASLIIIGSTGADSILAGGIGVIKYTMPTGCAITKNIYIRNNPVPTVTFNWATASFYTPDIYPHYQWYDSIQGKILAATSPTLAALHNQYYYVVVTDTFGCKGASAWYHFNTAVLETTTADNDKTIRIFPNPATGLVYIEANSRVRAVVSSMDGKLLLMRFDAKTIDIGSLANGMYQLELYDDSGNRLASRKLVKE